MSCLVSFIKMMGQEDELLLLSDGIYSLLPGTEAYEQLTLLLEKGKLYALEDDLLARGVDASNLLPNGRSISYDTFVDLVVKHQRTYNWA